MQTTIEIEGKPVKVSATNEADAILASRSLPLTVEMELYFSCLISKKVRFYQQDASKDSVVIHDKLSICFRPVMTENCSVNDAQPPITDFPMVNPKPYVPKWLYIDFRFGHWFGDFGYIAR